MRVLVATGIFPPDIGGPATYVPRLAGFLSSHGHQVTVLTLSVGLDHDDGSYPFRLVRIRRRMWGPVRIILTMFKILSLARKTDVVFVNGLYLETAISNLIGRKPLVLKVVGDPAWEPARRKGWVEDDFETFQITRYSLPIEILKSLRKWWTRTAIKVIAPSRYLGLWAARWGASQQDVVVIYNALGKLAEAAPPEVPLDTPARVVTVARLVPWKRVDGILDVIAKLPDVGLVVIGEGPDRSALERRVRQLGITDRVYMAGAKTKPETVGLMAACDIFVLNSTYEGLPHVILEAMSIGLPVVATSAGGTPEVVEDGINGRLIPVQDDQSLENAIKDLLESPDLQRRLSEGGKKVIERFSEERMLAETEALLKGVVESS